MFFSYAIKIGENNNTVSTISRIGPTPRDEQFETPNVLNCDAPTTFWVTWDSRDVRFGSGVQVGGNELGRYACTHPYHAAMLFIYENERVARFIQQD